MTASVRDLDLRRSEIASLVIRELVRARRVDSAPSEPADPADCLVTRAQLMTRELMRTHRIAIGLLEDALVSVQDPTVTHALSLTAAMARDVPSLMELDDLDLAAIVGQRFEQLRIAHRARLRAIAKAASSCGAGSIAKMNLLAENQDLRQAAFAYESALQMLTRMIRMNADFEQLCGMEPRISLR